MTLDCPLCGGLMRQLDTPGFNSVLYRCLHCRCAGTSNLVLQHQIAMTRLASVELAQKEKKP